MANRRKVENPHDAVFRRFMSRSAEAVAQLRAVLPAEVVEQADWDQLQMIGETLIDPELRERETDVLFTVPINGRTAFIYVLLEHQSSVEELMPFRMLRYVVRIWDRFLDENPKSSRLPAVLPVVVSNAEGGWTDSTSLSDWIDADPATGAALSELLQFRFILDDLARVDVEAIRDRGLSPAAFLVLVFLKSGRGHRDLGELLDQFAAELTIIEGQREDLTALLKYLSQVRSDTPEEFRQAAAKLGPAIQEAIMSTADILEARGEARGAVKGRAEALLQQVALKFGPPSPETIKRIDSATTEQLTDWTARILTATTIDEVLQTR